MLTTTNLQQLNTLTVIVLEAQNTADNLRRRAIRSMTNYDNWTAIAFAADWAELDRKAYAALFNRKNYDLLCSAIALVVTIFWTCYVSACEAIEYLAETTSPVAPSVYYFSPLYVMDLDDYEELTCDLWAPPELDEKLVCDVWELVEVEPLPTANPDVEVAITVQTSLYLLPAAPVEVNDVEDEKTTVATKQKRASSKAKKSSPKGKSRTSKSKSTKQCA
jgi:hypothetical protein